MNATMRDFPPFSLRRLLKTVFAPKPGERIAILIDLPDPARMKDYGFLGDKRLSIQRMAHDVFYMGLKEGGLAELGLEGGEMYAYQVTGGSNLELPKTAVDAAGRSVDFERQIYPRYNIFLCISTYSATAPLTAAAKRFAFRGSTMHGLNEIILRTGLSVDYNEVSRKAEQLRLGLTRAEAFEIDFEVAGQKTTLRILCNGQDAQKSHGIARGERPDVVNLPAGEVYFVPAGASGAFPMKYEDGTVGMMDVQDGRIYQARLVKGQQKTIDEHNKKLKSDPATGVLGELGFGTQELPPAGRDIQDEKILGTLHVATGRNDHLSGSLTPDKFKDIRNATHDDILFSPTKTPEITVRHARMYRGGRTEVVIENYGASPYLRGLMK